MSAEKTMSWHEGNQAYLTHQLATMRQTLERYIGSPDDALEDMAKPAVATDIAQLDPPPAIERLSQVFGLSAFERSILLLCAGVELDTSFARLVAAAQGDSRRSFPTFSLALAVFDDAHWSALSPSAPLRRWRLVEVNANESVTVGRVHIDERILHFLAGINHLDDRLTSFVEWIPIPNEPPVSYDRHVRTMVRVWSPAGESLLPVVQLCGDDPQMKRDIAAVACRDLGLNLYSIAAHAVPAQPVELDAFIKLWRREAVLSGCGLLVECSDEDASDLPRQTALARLCEEIRGVLVVSSRIRRATLKRPAVTLDVGKPTSQEQRAMWRSFLGEAGAGLNGSVERLASQFDLDATSIRSACSDAIQREQDPARLETALWDICRTHARPHLDHLAQRVVPAATWDDLVLPQSQKQLLLEIAIHVRQRDKVYEEWGFASTSSRGLGISALFSGPSGTGKTMAAEVLANELRLDLYRIDLSQVVSKYIGETEKNLRRVFDAAEAGSAILLFDEADALFGKRSEVRDSHDRYANVEISYLLQRMEEYRGLAILTTNMKNAMDSAFQRRIRFVVQFPFPDATQRAEIWRRIFPAAIPLDSLDYAQLARLRVAGGSIRNIAMNGAFLAAEAGTCVRMSHLLQAARSEYGKTEQPLIEAEIGGWR